MEWINNFREEIGLIVACLKCKKIEQKHIYNAEIARAKLLTRLNQNINKVGNEYNSVMSNMLDNIDFTDNCLNVGEISNTLIDLSRKILESEWQRVKREAGGDE